VVGVTDMDLFIPVLTFVFGEAQLGGRAAVVSTARLMPDGGMMLNGRLLVARLAKEAVHELGHSFGLTHCDESHCVMSRSTSLIDVDTKNGGLCHDCWTHYLELREGAEATHE
jgi:archaemetzincin